MAASSRGRDADVFALVLEISHLLNTNLDQRSLHYCIRLLESGVDPRALAEVVRYLQGLRGQDEQLSSSAL